MRNIILTILLMMIAMLAVAQNTATIGVLPDQGQTVPATCTVGQIYFQLGGTNGLYQCLTTNTWTRLSSGGGSGTVTTTGTPASGQMTAFSGATSITTATGHNAVTPLACPDSSGSGSAQVCNTSPTFTPAAGDCVIYTTTTANTGASLTLNVDSLGAKPVAKWQSTTTLQANDVRANTENLACYDGTNWELATIGNAPSGGGGGDTITSPNSTLTVGGTSTNTTLDLVGTAGEIMAGATPALTYTPTLGAVGHQGSLTIAGTTSGSLVVTTQGTAGTPTWTAGTSSGTPAVTASSPLAITTATGNITCSTCVTSAASLTSNAVVIGGGAQASSTISADTTTTHALFATGTAPAFRAIATGDLPTIPIAGGGTNATSAAAGTVPNATSGSASSWTATPTLGASGTLGSVTFGNATSGLLTVQPATGAITSYTIDLPVAQPTSGNTFLSCTAANPAVCTWTASSASVAWNNISNPSGNLSLTMGSNTSAFNTTTGLASFFTWANTTAAIVSASQSSPHLDLLGTEFHAAASAAGGIDFQFVPGTGTDAASTFAITHTGSATGTVTTTFPGPVQAGSSGGVGGTLTLPEGTAATASASNDVCYGDSTAHAIKCSWNNGSFQQIPQTSSTTTTTTQGLFATATAGVYAPRAIATGDLPTIPIAGGGTNATSAVAGSVPNATSGSASSWTSTPSLGVSGTAGTIAMFPASGNFTTTLGSAATASNTVNFFATAPTNLHTFYCATSSTTCTLTDTGYAYNSIPNADLANSAITIAGTSVALGGSTVSFPSPGAIGGTTPAAGTFTTLQANTQINAGSAGTLAPVVMGNATSGTLTLEPATGAITSYTIQLPVAQPTSGNTFLSCTAASPAVCTWTAGGGGGGVTSIATTSPITGGTITTTGTIACATCATTTNGGAISFDKSATGLINPTADATFTYVAGSTTGLTLAGTAPASVSTSTGTTATTLFNVNGVAGGATSNATGTGGVGSAPAITGGTGGAGTGTNAVGGAGGSITLTGGSGGASNGTGVNSNGANVVIVPGSPGTGGSGTAGVNGIMQVNNTNTAGDLILSQGTANSTTNQNIPANSVFWQAPTAVTAYGMTLPGSAFSGVMAGVNNSGVIAQKFTGDTAHYSSGAVTLGSATSIGSTALCSTTDCPAGNYQVNVYVDVTTACTTTGSYVVNVIYTDDTTASKTVAIPVTGTGVTSNSLALASTTNFATGQAFIHSTGSAGINYSTTAGACGSGGPAVGKFYLTVVPLS